MYFQIKKRGRDKHKPWNAQLDTWKSCIKDFQEKFQDIFNFPIAADVQ